MLQHAWTCRCCGKQQMGLPLDYGFKAPFYWRELPESERRAAAMILTSDLCRIGDDRFIRGCLEIPLVGRDEIFIWGVWVSFSEESIERALELWDQPTIDEHEPSRFGWLSNELSAAYGGMSTLNLKTAVYFRGGNQRPFIEIEPTDHPLSIEQRQGMSLQRVEEIAELLLRHD